MCSSSHCHAIAPHFLQSYHLLLLRSRGDLLCISPPRSFEIGDLGPYGADRYLGTHSPFYQPVASLQLWCRACKLSLQLITVPPVLLAVLSMLASSINFPHSTQMGCPTVEAVLESFLLEETMTSDDPAAETLMSRLGSRPDRILWSMIKIREPIAPHTKTFSRLHSNGLHRHDS